MTRLDSRPGTDAPAQTGPAALPTGVRAPCPAQRGRLAPSARRRRAECLECGQPYAARQASSEFCGSPCRAAWNNRRAVRGAEIYDLIMAWRYDRPAAQLLKLWTLICRMAAAFRRDDRLARAGRRSWRAPAAVVETRPWLQAKVMDSGGTRR